MPKKKPPKNLELYDKLIATHPEIERKGATTGYTSHNGHMFTYLSKDGELGIRLSKKDREEFISKYSAKILQQYGRNMPEYVHVPEKMLSKTAELKKYLALSYEYIKTLKPK